MTDNGNLEVKEIFEDDARQQLAFDVSGMGFFNWIAEAGITLPPWWSRNRDMELRRFWKSSDHLSGALSTMRQMMTSIPYKVLPRDPTVKAHIKAAKEFQFNLDNMSSSRTNQSDIGWSSMYGPFLEDFWSQDNGGWLVVEGDGIQVVDPTGNFSEGPLKPDSPRRLIHLDSARSWRTGNPVWPLYYTDWDGKSFFIHVSRILNLTSMKSPIQEMRGVGFCAVSRCPGIAQNLTDIVNYKQEKLGSRPKRGLLVIDGGGEKEATSISNKLMLADEQMDNAGLRRYAPIPIVGIRNGGTVSLVDLNSIPDGFDELTSTQLGMSVMALAFGVDVRTFSFAIGVSGQTKADAEIQHLKTSGRAPAEIIKSVKQQIEFKFLPPYLKIEFDFQDDAQDLLNADIRKKRAERREKDLTLGTTDIRVERQQMLENGELSEGQFIELELGDGRLENGESVLLLFQSSEKQIQELLTVTLDSSDEEINENIIAVQDRLINSGGDGNQSKLRMALAALKKLKENNEPVEELEPETDEQDETEVVGEELEDVDNSMD